MCDIDLFFQQKGTRQNRSGALLSTVLWVLMTVLEIRQKEQKIERNPESNVVAIILYRPGVLSLHHIIGSLSNHDGNAKENVVLKMTFKYFKFFAIVSTRLICLMQPNNPGADSVRTVLQFR